MLASVEEERCTSSRSTDSVVVGELQWRKKLVPVRLYVVKKARNIVFNVLFITFVCPSVCGW